MMQIRSTDKGGLTVVVGLGATGLACLRFLRGQGRRVGVTDSRSEPPRLNAARELDAAMPIAVGGFDHALLRSATEIVLSPGVPCDEPVLREARAAGIPVIGEIELFARHANGPVVGITGSNGKSTVTTLLGCMAEAAGRNVAVGGNLGTPALDLLRDPAPGAYILELSSFQLETTSSLRPVAAVVLNISADHLDRHGSVERYARIKAGIYNGDGLMVLNADDSLVMAMASDDRRQVRFSTGLPLTPGDYGLGRNGEEIWLMHGETRLVEASSLRIRGIHNLANALAALALADALALPRQTSIEALQAFPGLPHRSQWVAGTGGVDWYNDSKATNIG
ncbi:MAG: UDP-N-acetylmuramoyl-L-alanine--D-glutamate ligase, partial [Aquisalimonadaceae bacterium]